MGRKPFVFQCFCAQIGGGRSAGWPAAAHPLDQFQPGTAVKRVRELHAGFHGGRVGCFTEPGWIFHVGQPRISSGSAGFSTTSAPIVGRMQRWPRRCARIVEFTSTSLQEVQDFTPIAYTVHHVQVGKLSFHPGRGGPTARFGGILKYFNMPTPGIGPAIFAIGTGLIVDP